MKLFKLFLLIPIIVFSIYFVNALTDCGSIAEAGNYALSNDINISSGTCLDITTSNVSVDCQGHAINFSIIGEGIGIRVGSGSTNITIKNCILVQENFSASGTIYAIQFLIESASKSPISRAKRLE